MIWCLVHDRKALFRFARLLRASRQEGHRPTVDEYMTMQLEIEKRRRRRLGKQRGRTAGGGRRG